MNYFIWRHLKQDRWGLLGLVVVVLFFLIALLVWAGLLGQNWSQITPMFHGEADTTHWLGTNGIGQDVFDRMIYSTKVVFEVGLVVTCCSLVLGVFLGCLSGYNQGHIIDTCITWLIGVLDSIPFYLFVAAMAYALKGLPFAMHLAMILTFWTTTARLIRSEVHKIKALPYTTAAFAMGLSSARTLFKHILPNTSHIILIQSTITFVAAVKTEVILSFLGIGIKTGVSWGLMIAESTGDIMAGHLNNFLAASISLFVLVVGFNLLSDALQDAYNPHTMRTQ